MEKSTESEVEEEESFQFDIVGEIFEAWKAKAGNIALEPKNLKEKHMIIYEFNGLFYQSKVHSFIVSDSSTNSTTKVIDIKIQNDNFFGKRDQNKHNYFIKKRKDISIGKRKRSTNWMQLEQEEFKFNLKPLINFGNELFHTTRFMGQALYLKDERKVQVKLFHQKFCVSIRFEFGYPDEDFNGNHFQKSLF